MTQQTNNKKVLVVDDSETIRRTAEALLKKEGYEVGVAEDGFQAFAAIVDFSPSIIFLDIMMPRLDGYQVCSVIKNNPEYEHIPVIMLSSKDNIFDKARGRVSGSEFFMSKPFSKEELINVINQHLK
ncbi:response regulator [Ostreibacterium oceani]|uniref:Response regulator n=1 Tax=Ostreibacterium oceani TaxID=2654998 RepID=A0A6N7EV17_9GAMM|nr:response regulator [Ostreibacterium oceani]